MQGALDVVGAPGALDGVAELASNAIASPGLVELAASTAAEVAGDHIADQLEDLVGSEVAEFAGDQL